MQQQDVEKHIQNEARHAFDSKSRRRGNTAVCDYEDAVQETHVCLREDLGENYLTRLAQENGEALATIRKAANKAADRVRLDDGRKKRGLRVPVATEYIDNVTSTNESTTCDKDMILDLFNILNSLSNRERFVTFVYCTMKKRSMKYEEAICFVYQHQQRLDVDVDLNFPQSTFYKVWNQVKDRLEKKMEGK